MMKTLSLLFAMMLISISCYSQDVIIKKTGEEVKAKIIELTPEFIKFKKFNNEDGPIYTVKKSEIFKINYANGEYEVIKDTSSEKSSKDLAMQGKKDAQMHYKKKKTGAGWTSATTIIFSPIIGVIPAAVCSSSEPTIENLKFPDVKLMDEYEYNMAYTEKATKMKRRKVWSSFGISSGAWVILFLLL